MREIQNQSNLPSAGKYNKEAFRQFTLRSWVHKPECNEIGISCGIRTLCNLAAMPEPVFVNWVNKVTPLAGDQQFLEDGYTYIFSDVVNSYGGRVAEYIRKYDLGTIMETPSIKNPNSGNWIQVWIWTYNGKTIPNTVEVSGAA